jgi:4'-phosphopantetheinyl transferase
MRFSSPIQYFSSRTAKSEPIGVPSAHAVERRSKTRPHFADGWRKSFASPPPRSAAASNETSGQVHVWTASPRSILNARSCLQLLSEEDRVELGQISSTSVREASTAAKILLRLALSRASNRAISAADWHFRRDGDGKPIVGDGQPQIHFSVSHCSSAVAVAVSPTLRVGIDVESVDQVLSEGVAHTFFSQFERNNLSRLRSTQRERETLRLWTLKEAFSKLIGTGLSNNFDAIEFSLSPTTLHHGERNSEIRSTYFEALHIASSNDFCLATLAVGADTAVHLCGEVQVISLADQSMELVTPRPSVSA